MIKEFSETDIESWLSNKERHAFMKEIEAYVRGQCSQAMPNPKHWYFFGSTKQFKTCKSFLEFLRAKHPSYEFMARIVK